MDSITNISDYTGYFLTLLNSVIIAVIGYRRVNKGNEKDIFLNTISEANESTQKLQDNLYKEISRLQDQENKKNALIEKQDELIFNQKKVIQELQFNEITLNRKIMELELEISRKK